MHYHMLKTEYFCGRQSKVLPSAVKNVEKAHRQSVLPPLCDYLTLIKQKASQ